MPNDSTPVVSIIVPARNEEASLAACLESLIAQTGIDFEIFVVDDDSTDRTAEIARSFAGSKDIPGSIESNANAGRSATTGKGTTCSRAENRSDALNGTAESRALPAPAAAQGAAPSALLGKARSSTTHVAADTHVRPEVHIISAPSLPANWTGKNNAMAAGAKIAKGKWLLFTDADTVHKPGSLVRAIAEAEERGADLLSYSPEQEVRTFWEKAVMPVIFAELATTYPPQAVNDPKLPIAAANGQYLLISREAYDAVGGHEAIANNLLEDVALARLIKSSGRRVFFRYGGDAVQTRMYRSFAQMKEGWTKNLAQLFQRPIALAALRLAEFVLILANAMIAVWAEFSGRSNLALQTTLLTLILAGWFWLRIRKAHFPISSNIVAILGLPVFSELLVRSKRSHGRNAVGWKGRQYGSRPASPVASESFMERVEDLPVQERQN
jgi:glycosyltransferase involved in cell wall biosynthesis